MLESTKLLTHTLGDSTVNSGDRATRCHGEIPVSHVGIPAFSFVGVLKRQKLDDPSEI